MLPSPPKSPTQNLAYWKGFLPSRAIVMARTRTSVAKLDSLERLAADLQGCTRCGLCQARKTIVIGEGNPQASLIFVGEGPGEAEDLQGRPFVGAAGQLLDRMISAITLRREDVYLCNIVKCRPPGDRDPAPEEIAACRPFLERQLQLLQPRVIVALGRFATETLVGTGEDVAQLRGSFQDYRGIPLMPTFHPSFLLRNPGAKRDAWADLKQVAQALGLHLPEKRN